MEVIYEFRYEFGFLSNFYPAQVSLDGMGFPSVEHAYQAAKTLDHGERSTIREAASPAEAKKMGRGLLHRRPDWEEAKETIMLDLLRQKFSNNALGERLLATGGAVLIEGNGWGDRYWGVSGGSGLNRLGILLMTVRQELEATRAPV